MPEPLPPSFNKYAGIGSRETPPDVLKFMKVFGSAAALCGILLRSGRARGADTAFEWGCDASSGPKEIFTAVDVTPEAMAHAAEFHPRWHGLKSWAKKLHARNSMIILGKDLDDPVDIVYCWTPNGVKIGGTAQGLRVAEHYDIPIINLGDEVYRFDG